MSEKIPLTIGELDNKFPRWRETVVVGFFTGWMEKLTRENLKITKSDFIQRVRIYSQGMPSSFHSTRAVTSFFNERKLEMGGQIINHLSAMKTSLERIYDFKKEVIGVLDHAFPMRDYAVQRWVYEDRKIGKWGSNVFLREAFKSTDQGIRTIESFLETNYDEMYDIIYRSRIGNRDELLERFELKVMDDD